MQFQVAENWHLGIGAFAVSTELDQVFGILEAGITVFEQDRFKIGLKYLGQLLDKNRVHQGQVKASFTF